LYGMVPGESYGFVEVPVTDAAAAGLMLINCRWRYGSGSIPGVNSLPLAIGFMRIDNVEWVGRP
jgi:hypothetical protein